MVRRARGGPSSTTACSARTISYLDFDSPRWLKIPNRDDQPDFTFLRGTGDERRTIREFLTVQAPQSHASADLTRLYSYFGIARAFLHDVDESPREELSHLAPLFDGAARPGWESQPAGKALAERIRLRSFVGLSIAGPTGSPPTMMRAGLAGCWKIGLLTNAQ